MNITNLKLREMRDLLDKKSISAIELTQEYLNRINKFDDKIQSYITVTEDLAMDSAKKAQEKIDNGNTNPLCGIPISIKDNICTNGIKTTCASKSLENFIPPYNATVVDKLDSQNAVMLGKTNLDEFAIGATTQSSVFAKTKNPFDLSKVPGGSSGGSAASVSASLCAASIASDTGGSLRQPAALCGVTGLKPTYGRVSRHGLVAIASSMDQIGAIAKDAHDCAFILNTIAGFDCNDATSSKAEVIDFTSKIGESIKGLKIAIPKEFYDSNIGINSEVKNSVLAAAEKYKKMGAELVECCLPSLKYAVATYLILSSAEAASNLSRIDGIKYGHRSTRGENFNELIINSRTEGFGDEVKRRILLGNFVLSIEQYDDYYKKALALRQRFITEYADIFEKCDVILTPTTLSTATRTDENISTPFKTYLDNICTVSSDIASLPAISTTCGYDSNGMPIGMSIIGKKFDEATIVQVADAFEKSFNAVSPELI